MRLACLFLPHLPVQVEIADNPTLAERPLVIGGKPWDPGVVLDCCPQAADSGVLPNMPLAQAETLCPHATFLPARDEAYREVHDLLITAAKQTCPLVETEQLGFLYAEISGLERLLGSETKLAQRLLDQSQRLTELVLQTGTGANKFTALQAARAARPGGWCVVPAGDERAFLAPLLLPALELARETLRRL